MVTYGRYIHAPKQPGDITPAPPREYLCSIHYSVGQLNPAADPELSRPAASVTANSSSEPPAEDLDFSMPERPPPPPRPLPEQRVESVPGLEDNILYLDIIEKDCKMKLSKGGSYLGTLSRSRYWKSLQDSTKQGNRYLERNTKILRSLLQRRDRTSGGPGEDGDDAPATMEAGTGARQNRGRSAGPGRGQGRGRGIGVNKRMQRDRAASDGGRRDGRVVAGGRGGEHSAGRGRGGVFNNADLRRHTQPVSPPPIRRIHGSPPDPRNAKPIKECRSSWGGGGRGNRDAIARGREPFQGNGKEASSVSSGAKSRPHPNAGRGGDVTRRSRDEQYRPAASSERRGTSRSKSRSESRDSGGAPPGDQTRWKGGERGDRARQKRARIESERSGDVRSGRAVDGMARQASGGRGSSTPPGKEHRTSQGGREKKPGSQRSGDPAATSKAGKRQPGLGESSVAGTFREPRLSGGRGSADQAQTGRDVNAAVHGGGAIPRVERGERGNPANSLPETISGPFSPSR